MGTSETELTAGEVTRLIGQLRDGGDTAARRLLPLVYGELRALAQAFLNGEAPGHTLQPTALVHEAFVKLSGNADARWEDRAHIFAVAAMAMRSVLTDHARRKRTAKRGGAWQRVTLSGIGSDARDRAFDACDLDEALEDLGKLSERQAHIVELRFFGGLTAVEVAQVLEVSERTVRGDWRLA